MISPPEPAKQNFIISRHRRPKPQITFRSIKILIGKNGSRQRNQRRKSIVGQLTKSQFLLSTSMPGPVFYLVFGEKMPREIKPAKQISRLAVQHICHVIKDHFFRSEHFQHDFNGKRVAKRFRNWKIAAICKASASALKFQCVLHSFIYEDKAGGSMPYFHSIVIVFWRFIVFCFKFQSFHSFLMF